MSEVQEEWRPVVGFEGLYEVSDRGRVRSLDRVDSRGWRFKGRVMRCASDARGYRRVRLSRAGTQSTRLVHRLVAEAHIGPPPTGARLVRHLNDDPNDNRVENLSYGTDADNKLDAIRNGLNVNSSKASCLRGHLLSGANKRLKVGASGRPGRQCNACLRALQYARSNPEINLDIQSLADAHYREILRTGRVGHLPQELINSCQQERVA